MGVQEHQEEVISTPEGRRHVHIRAHGRKQTYTVHCTFHTHDLYLSFIYYLQKNITENTVVCGFRMSVWIPQLELLRTRCRVIKRTQSSDFRSTLERAARHQFRTREILFFSHERKSHRPAVTASVIFAKGNVPSCCFNYILEFL